MSDLLCDDLTVPDDLPSWVAAFLREAAAETATLRENGAEGAVAARMAVLRKLMQAASACLNEELDTSHAAAERGVSPETIRRAVRGGRLPDHRPNPRGALKIRRGDLRRIATPTSASYDPVADAQDIARLRRKT
jgi:hypothetical protein